MNTTLKSLNEIVSEIRFLDSVNGRLHQTFYKNWDLGVFMRFVLERYDRFAAILDVGCVGNPLLFNLASNGYSNIWGIDSQLTGENIYTHPNIQYIKADLMRSPFGPHRFDCITSLSVVEHGVEPERYFRELSRILKSGGVLLTSTDYWPRKIRTWTVPRKITFGLPWKIFSEGQIRKLISVSEGQGFRLLAPLDYTANERVVHYFGKAYTFITFALVRQER